MDRIEYAIIVAAGKGLRLKSVTPKQFLHLCGKPVLLHALDAFIRYSANIRIVLVLHRQEFETWRTIARDFQFTFPVELRAGGDSRFQSVKNGLQAIEGGGLVAIHDGVRPLISTSVIAASFQVAAQHGSAVASVPLKDSIRRIEGVRSSHVDRSGFRLIQTPQTFDADLIRRAYETKEDETLTDDASVVEQSGHSITLIDGSYDNLKITTSDDLLVAEALLRAKAGL